MPPSPAVGMPPVAAAPPRLASSSESVVGAAASGFVSLFSGALAAKVVTFASTVFIARVVGRAALGVGTLQLDELLFLGPLVMTRDGLRKVAYRVDEGRPDVRQSLVNLCWATAPVAMAIGMIGAMGLLRNQQHEGEEERQRFARAIWLTMLALVLGVAHEPAVLLAQSRMDQALRARCEMAAVLAKCGAMVAALAVAPQVGVQAFAAGNVAYAAVLCALYLRDWRSQGGAEQQATRAKPVSAWPVRVADGEWWDASLLAAAREFWLQSVQKWALENGEKVALVFLGTQEQAGEYALVSNLGSIVARLLFQPLEEMALAAFGRLSAASANENYADAERRRARQAARQAFSVLLRLLVLLGLVFACFGPAYSHLLLHLLYGPSWSATSAPTVLAWYCWYIFVMAVNGLCEAFVQGVATTAQLREYNYWMAAFSACFLAAVALLVPYGATGIVGANIVKMACRISVCGWAYIRPVFQEPGASVAAMVPSLAVLCAFAVSAILCQASEAWLYKRQQAGIAFWVAAGQHVAIGIFCLVLTFGCVWRWHGRALARDIRELRG